MTVRPLAWSSSIVEGDVAKRSMSYIWTSTEVSIVPVICHCQVVPGCGCQGVDPGVEPGALGALVGSAGVLGVVPVPSDGTASKYRPLTQPGVPPVTTEYQTPDCWRMSTRVWRGRTRSIR